LPKAQNKIILDNYIGKSRYPYYNWRQYKSGLINPRDLDFKTKTQNELWVTKTMDQTAGW
jgi:hypothetical protein